MSSFNVAERFSALVQVILNIGLVILTSVLIIFLGKETAILFNVLFYAPNEGSNYLLIEGVVTYFLYFEFIALIVKYFKSNYHFPLHYFIYIGITAIVRLIIVDHDNPMSTLLYAGAILVLVVALYIATGERLKKE